MTNRARRRFGSRSAAAWAVTAALAATLASAQDDARPDQLKKRYADALAQLKQSQDRKNQLAADNERLTAKLADLQKQLDAANGRIATLKAAADGFERLPPRRRRIGRPGPAGVAVPDAGVTADTATSIPTTETRRHGESKPREPERSTGGPKP
jgi:chromosome segregation ATPase